MALVVSLIWLITALAWLWEWARARALLKPLVEELRQAIRDSEAARLGLFSDYKSAVGTICPRCARTTYGGSDSPLGLQYCGYCGSPLVAR